MTADFQSYFICTSPRSGSTLLCHLLRDTKMAGNPHSHFHKPSLDAWCSYYGLNHAGFIDDRACLRAILSAAQTLGRGDGDIFGLRLQQGSFDFFLAQLAKLHADALSDAERIEATFGRTLYIHLTRQTKLDQAISLETALQSGLWHRRGDGSELERLSSHQTSIYNAAAIREHIEVAQAKEQAWQDWFQSQRIAPLRITYEALSAAPFQTRNQIMDALGIAAVVPHTDQTRTAKLADKTSHQWAHQFRKDHPNVVTSDMSVAFDDL